MLIFPLSRVSLPCQEHHSHARVEATAWLSGCEPLTSPFHPFLPDEDELRICRPRVQEAQMNHLPQQGPKLTTFHRLSVGETQSGMKR